MRATYGSVNVGTCIKIEHFGKPRTDSIITICKADRRQEDDFFREQFVNLKQQAKNIAADTIVLYGLEG